MKIHLDLFSMEEMLTGVMISFSASLRHRLPVEALLAYRSKQARRNFKVKCASVEKSWIAWFTPTDGSCIIFPLMTDPHTRMNGAAIDNRSLNDKVKIN